MMRLNRLAVGAFAFCLLAILNCGGYRYGIGDQAFHIPAILRHLDSSLFPRDRALLSAQDGFMLFDDAVAAAVRASGLSLPVLFLAAYLAGLLLLFGGALYLGRLCFRSGWTATALVLMLTLRHRITQTGVNTLEGSLLPRTIAFALGVWALAVFVRGGGLWALVLVLAAGLLHPTTALWFALWIGVGLIVSEPRLRRRLLAAGMLGAAVAAWAVWKGPLRGRLVTMDPQWISVLAGKDYVFPSDWGLSFWLVNLAYLPVILAIHRYRRSQGEQFPREAGVVCGAAALVAVFLLSWPLAAARVALVIQLQVSRVFWMLDFLATAYLVWLAVEARRPHTARGTVRRSVVVAIAILAAIRGGYVMRAEGPGASIVKLGLPDDQWSDVMAWTARTPASTHVLVDPGHAWKYGTSVRVAGQRDVYLEEVKDAAIAMYSREVAMRVSRRIEDLGDFSRLTPEKARSLAVQYDLDYLITDSRMALPIAYQNSRFRVYALAGRGPTER
jgi:hypothetical protein